MAADPPLSHLVLAAGSVADDLGFVALADLRTALGEETGDYRIIGGHMVTALAARWQLGPGLYRETGDADLGVPPVVIRDRDVVGRLRALGYRQVAGNRFAKTVPDIPVRPAGGPFADREAIIDVLVPAYTSRARQNVRVSEDLFSTEVPGLPTALSRPPVMIGLEMHRLGGEALHAELPFPDEVSALVLKSHATRVRVNDTDVTDIWRCLEAAYAAGVAPAMFADGIRAESADLIRALFASLRGPGMTAIAAGQGMTRQAADARYTRVRALIARVLGPG
ncbi:MAG TPA: hypothetical protein VGA04_12080 [Streptosporangiaceae bacterium]